jgi:nitroreductase
MGVSLYELLKNRRMVRYYTGEPVSRDVLERIAKTVRRASSAGYSQGVRLLVVDDREVMAPLGPKPEDGEIARRWFDTAPVHIVVLVREQDYHDRYNQPDKLERTGGEEVVWPVPFWHVDAGTAMMLLLLAALEEGLGAGVYGVPVEEDEKWREVLRIPRDLTIVAVVTVGAPAANDPDYERASSAFTQRRKPYDELIHWNRWSHGDGSP